MQFEISSFTSLNTISQPLSSDDGEKLVQLLLEDDEQEDFSTNSGCSEIRSSDSFEHLAGSYPDSSQGENSFSKLAFSQQMT